MRKALLALLAVSALALSLSLWGCGVADDFEASNRLVVTGITSSGSNIVVANATEITDDSGTDGDSSKVDPDGTQGNGRPDPGETITTGLLPDLGTITLQNESLSPSDAGVDLVVFRVDITYRDANSNSRAFAPVQSYRVSRLVPKNGTADLAEMILVPLGMKTDPAVDAVRDIFLFGSSASEIAAVRNWTAIVDVYAEDQKNGNTVHAKGNFSIQFVEPMR